MTDTLDDARRERVITLYYQEAWKQYSHEDVLADARMRNFLTLNAATVGFCGVILAQLLKHDAGGPGPMQFGVAGIMLVLAGSAMAVFCRGFAMVNEAGRVYVELRHQVLCSLEEELGVEGIGSSPAKSEAALLVAPKNTDPASPTHFSIREGMPSIRRIMPHDGFWFARMSGRLILLTWVVLAIGGAALVAYASQMSVPVNALRLGSAPNAE